MSGEKQSALPDGFAVENFDRNDDFIKSRIFTIRGVQVMLDSDLARIYQVETRVFNQAVKRNANRFPSDFRFRLEMEEYRSLISQIVTSKVCRKKHVEVINTAPSRRWMRCSSRRSWRGFEMCLFVIRYAQIRRIKAAAFSPS